MPSRPLIIIAIVPFPVMPADVEPSDLEQRADARCAVLKVEIHRFTGARENEAGRLGVGIAK